MSLKSPDYQSGPALDCFNCHAPTLAASDMLGKCDVDGFGLLAPTWEQLHECDDDKTIGYPPGVLPHFTAFCALQRASRR